MAVAPLSHVTTAAPALLPYLFEDSSCFSGDDADTLCNNAGLWAITEIASTAPRSAEKLALPACFGMKQAIAMLTRLHYRFYLCMIF